MKRKKKKKSAQTKLREVRARAGMSQAELASLIGVDDSTVARYESEDPGTRRLPRLRNAIRIAEVTEELGHIIRIEDWA